MAPEFNFFGWSVKRQPEPETQKSFATKVEDDGAVIVQAGGTYNQYVDLDGTIKTEAELVSKYRDISLQPEIDRAINEITNEAIVCEDNKPTVDIVLDDLQISENVKKIITAEFNTILDLLDFKNNAYDIFKRWYIDGRSYYHVVIDEALPGEGIKELRYIDPRKIRKVREVVKVKDRKTDAIIQRTKQEYYVFNDRGLNSGTRQLSELGGTAGIKIKDDSIIHIVSGLMDKNNTLVLSYLHPSIKPLNQLRSLEDSTLIYHLSRAPERRIFKIDVGNLPKMKAEQHLREMMARYKNKLSYDAATGEVKDDRKFMTMLEDFWLPIREGGRGTQIDVLSGGTQLTQLLDSVSYFEDKLFRSLQVPMSRLKPDSMTTLGRATEISRDEMNFQKFVDRIRNKFSILFMEALEKQLILKAVTTPDDWEVIKKYIRFRFLRDTYVSEVKDLEIWQMRMELLQMADMFAGKYYSHNKVQKEIMRMDEEEQEEEAELISQEFENPQYNQQLMANIIEQEQEAAIASKQAKAQNAAGGSPKKAKTKPKPKAKKKSEKK